MPAVSYRSQITPISVISGPEQASRLFDAIIAVLAGETSPTYPALPVPFIPIPVGGAGFTPLRVTMDHEWNANVAFKRCMLLRYPQLDRHNLYGQLLLIHTVNGSNVADGFVRWQRVFDASLCGPWTTATSEKISTGGWQDGGLALDLSLWPNLGFPRVTPANGSGVGANEGAEGFIGFTGNDLYDFFIVGSEYGLTVSNVTAAPGSYQVAEGREFDIMRLGRDIRFDGVSAGWPAPIIAAPTAAAPNDKTLRIRCDGQDFDVDLPSYGPGAPYFGGAFQYDAEAIAQRISQVGLGFFEGDSRDENGLSFPSIRIPEARVPAGEYSVSRPGIQLLHQDPTLVAAGIDYSLYNGASTAIVQAAPGGTIQVVGQRWPDMGLSSVNRGARIGGRVYNVNLDQYAVITGYSGTPTDTLIVDDTTTGGGWLNTHILYVLPGPEDHTQGLSSIGGCSPAMLVLNQNDPLLYGGLQQIRLNDYSGELFDHFEAGQEVFLAANSNFVYVEVDSIVGWSLGDYWEVTTAAIPEQRSKGIIRFIDPGVPAFWVEVIRGPKPDDLNNYYQTAPLAFGVSIEQLDANMVGTGLFAIVALVGYADGPTSPVNPPTYVGWMARVPVVAVGTTNALLGDFRTTLVLNMGATEINPNISIWPGFYVGVRAKEKIFHQRRLDPQFATDSLFHVTPIIEDVFLLAPQAVDQDVQKERRPNNSDIPFTQSPSRTPDASVGSYGAETIQVIIRHNRIAADVIGTLPHISQISAKAPGSSISQFDSNWDDGDLKRPSIAVATYNNAGLSDPSFGAGLGSTGGIGVASWSFTGPGRNLE